MRVEKFTKLKNGMYKLLLEDGSNIMAHEDLILKNDILLTREMHDEDIADIDRLNNNYSAYDIAVKYISSKYRSYYEVYKYLLDKEIDRDIINEVINRLKKQKYLDDGVFSKAFVNDRLKFSNYGPHKIRRELEERRVASDIIDDALEGYDSSLECERLDKLVPKYVKTIRNKSYSMMCSKVSEYFANLGYDRSLVIDVLKNVDYDDSESRKKEYDRLYRKYSKKYSGSELELKIKQSLYKNGYH